MTVHTYIPIFSLSFTHTLSPSLSLSHTRTRAHIRIHTHTHARVCRHTHRCVVSSSLASRSTASSPSAWPTKCRSSRLTNKLETKKENRADAVKHTQCLVRLQSYRLYPYRPNRGELLSYTARTIIAWGDLPTFSMPHFPLKVQLPKK